MFTSLDITAKLLNPQQVTRHKDEPMDRRCQTVGRVKGKKPTYTMANYEDCLKTVITEQLPVTKEFLETLITACPGSTEFGKVWCDWEVTGPKLLWIWSTYVPSIVKSNDFEDNIRTDKTAFTMFTYHDLAYAIFSLYNNWDVLHKFALARKRVDWMVMEQPSTCFNLMNEVECSSARKLIDLLEDAIFDVDKVKSKLFVMSAFVKYYRKKQRAGLTSKHLSAKRAKEEEIKEEKNDYAKRMRRSNMLVVAPVSEGSNTVVIMVKTENGYAETKVNETADGGMKSFII